MTEAKTMPFVRDDGGRIAAGYKGSAGDCVVRAVAIASGRSYQEIYDRLSEGSRTQRVTKRTRRKKSARDGVNTRRKWFKDYMAALGFEWVPTMQIGSGCTVHLAEGELPMGRLIVAVSTHYTAVIDGVIHDTHNPQRGESFMFEPDHGQELKANQGRNVNGVWTQIGGRCVYGYWRETDT